jgi:hypothetical protein
MKDKTLTLAICTGIILCGFVIFLTEIAKKEEYKLSCELLMGGWHPDLPQKFKQACEDAKKEKSNR